MKLNVNIQRGQEVNAFLFDALGAVAYSGKHDLESAYKALQKCFKDHALYRICLGRRTISIGTVNSAKRIASISEPA